MFDNVITPELEKLPYWLRMPKLLSLFDTVREPEFENGLLFSMPTLLPVFDTVIVPSELSVIMPLLAFPMPWLLVPEFETMIEPELDRVPPELKIPLLKPEFETIIVPPELFERVLPILSMPTLLSCVFFTVIVPELERVPTVLMMP